MGMGIIGTRSTGHTDRALLYLCHFFRGFSNVYFA